MKLSEAKASFIQTWGKLGSEWGINRTMAQVHALLLISPQPLTTEEVMDELSISRGNANMNLRELVNWNLVQKVLVPGERKEYFEAEKDVWAVARSIAKERKRREIDPLHQALEKLSQVEGRTGDPEVKAFKGMMKDLDKMVIKTGAMVDAAVKADENWFFSKITGLFK